MSTLVRCGLVVAAAFPLACRGADVVWSIGQADNSADEFGRGATRSVVYDVGSGDDARNWPARQSVGDNNTIRFALRELTSANYLLVVRGFFLEAGPSELHVSVNGHKGVFRLTPTRGDDSDFRQGGNFLYSVFRVDVPIDARLLQVGANTIGLKTSGEGAGVLNYDSLAFEPLNAPPTKGDAVRVEPTIFFRQTPAGLREITHVIVNHSARLVDASVSLRIGTAAPLVAKISDDGADFGEASVVFDVPADLPAGPCEIVLRTAGHERTFAREFRPEKRWKLYASLSVHNDLGYTNLQKDVQAKHERNTDLILKALREHPAHKFNLENSWLADTYLGSRTASLAQELLTRAREGRLGVSAMYLNLLTGLCSGEELYRAMYFSASLHREHGVPIRSASLTDTPSQSWGLSSALADAGVAGFALGSNQHRGPLLINSNLNEISPFWWEGPDGRRLLTFIGRAYHQVGRMAGRNSLSQMARNLSQALSRYRRADYPLDALYLLGFLGDNNDVRDAGTGIVARWNAAYAFPKIIPATDAEYYDYVAGNFGPQLPVVRGDLGSYWADAAGASARDTIKTRDAQHTLPAAEMMAAWASLLTPEIAYPAGEIRDGWREILFYDEHSWGANNSITQPGQRFGAEQIAFKSAHAERATRIAHDLLRLSIARVTENISGGGPAVMAINPGVHAQTAMIEAEIDANQQIYDLTSDKPVALDIVAEHAPRDVGNGLSHWYSGLVRPWRTVRFLAADVPGLGYRSYEVRRAVGVAPSQNRSLKDSWEMDGKFYRIVLDPATGAIRSVFDKELGRELVDANAPHKLNELVYAAGGEGQRIINNLHGWPPTQLDVSGQMEARLVEHVRTPLGERIRIAARARNVPAIESEIVVYDQLKRIDIVNRIRKDDILQKEAIYFAFPFAVTPPELRYQVHNGWVQPENDLLPGACRDFFTTQNLVLASDPAVTIAFATPDLPLVTLTDLNRGRWSKTFETKNGHVYSYVTNNYWDTNIPASQSGELTFRYYLTTLRRLDYERVADFDAATRTPAIAYHMKRWRQGALSAGSNLVAAQGSFLSVDAPNVQISAFKKAEDGDGWIARLLEIAGRSGTARLSSKLFPIQAAFLANGVEENQTALAPQAGNVEVPLLPHRFSTVRLKFADR